MKSINGKFIRDALLITTCFLSLTACKTATNEKDTSDKKDISVEVVKKETDGDSQTNTKFMQVAKRVLTKDYGLSNVQVDIDSINTKRLPPKESANKKEKFDRITSGTGNYIFAGKTYTINLTYNILENGKDYQLIHSDTTYNPDKVFNIRLDGTPDPNLQTVDQETTADEEVNERFYSIANSVLNNIYSIEKPEIDYKTLEVKRLPVKTDKESGTEFKYLTTGVAKFKKDGKDYTLNLTYNLSDDGKKFQILHCDSPIDESKTIDRPLV
ncbi:hypothetical protein BG261_08850 [Floricoccus tropicus]|uniref:Uncharacterized protein n=1 Tax=Floricoccus tropicus TaxID=1859473 RepID=A0A1E8GPQ7_9LACT|nr:hypothetical protein [Floricoccus tropicus]OFI50219.1 hypothetical protein BG261_08850 [Floricoccus tropicus]